MEATTKTHNFKKTTFKSPTWCYYCSDFIWGVFNQGYQCTDCKYAVHKGDCKRAALSTPCDKVVEVIEGVIERGNDSTELVKPTKPLPKPPSSTRLSSNESNRPPLSKRSPQRMRPTAKSTPLAKAKPKPGFRGNQVERTSSGPTMGTPAVVVTEARTTAAPTSHRRDLVTGRGGSLDRHVSPGRKFSSSPSNVRIGQSNQADSPVRQRAALRRPTGTGLAPSTSERRRGRSISPSRQPRHGSQPTSLSPSRLPFSAPGTAPREGRGRGRGQQPSSPQASRKPRPKLSAASKSKPRPKPKFKPKSKPMSNTLCAPKRRARSHSQSTLPLPAATNPSLAKPPQKLGGGGFDFGSIPESQAKYEALKPTELLLLNEAIKLARGGVPSFERSKAEDIDPLLKWEVDNGIEDLIENDQDLKVDFYREEPKPAATPKPKQKPKARFGPSQPKPAATPKPKQKPKARFGPSQLQGTSLKRSLSSGDLSNERPERKEARFRSSNRNRPTSIMWSEKVDAWQWEDEPMDSSDSDEEWLEWADKQAKSKISVSQSEESLPDGSEVLFKISHVDVYELVMGNRKHLGTDTLYVLWHDVSEFSEKFLPAGSEGTVSLRFGFPAENTLSILRPSTPTVKPMEFKYCCMYDEHYYYVKLPQRMPYLASRRHRETFEYYLLQYSAYEVLDYRGKHMRIESRDAEVDDTARKIVKPPKTAELLNKMGEGINVSSYHVASGIVTITDKFDSGLTKAVGYMKDHTSQGDPDTTVNPKVKNAMQSTRKFADRRIYRNAEKIAGGVEKAAMWVGHGAVVQVRSAGGAAGSKAGKVMKDHEKKKNRAQLKKKRKQAAGGRDYFQITKAKREEQKKKKSSGGMSVTVESAKAFGSCCAQAMSNFLSAVDWSLDNVAQSIRDNATEAAVHKWGNEVGQCVYDGTDALGRVGLSAWKFQKLISHTYLAKNFACGVVRGWSLALEVQGEPWKVGLVHLQGLLVEGWILRMFMIKTKCLCWYNADNRYTREPPNGYLPLDNIRKVMVADDRCGKENSLMLKYKKRLYFMAFETTAARDEWMNAILAVRNFVQTYKVA